MITRQHRTRNLVLNMIVLAALFSATVATAQTKTAHRTAADREHILGVGAMLSYPFGDFENNYERGFGLHAMLDYPAVSILSWIADVGWNTFPLIVNDESITVMEYSFGMKAVFGPFFMGGETGYYSKVEDWSFVPSLGLKFGQFEMAIRIKAVGGGSWTGLRGGIYF